MVQFHVNCFLSVKITKAAKIRFAAVFQEPLTECNSRRGSLCLNKACTSFEWYRCCRDHKTLHTVEKWIATRLANCRVLTSGLSLPISSICFYSTGVKDLSRLLSRGRSSKSHTGGNEYSNTFLLGHLPSGKRSWYKQRGCRVFPFAKPYTKCISAPDLSTLFNKRALLTRQLLVCVLHLVL